MPGTPRTLEPAKVIARAMELLGVDDIGKVIDAITALIPSEGEPDKSLPAAMSRLRSRDAEVVAMRGALEVAHAELARRVAAAGHTEESASDAVEKLISMGRILPGARSFYSAFARTDAVAFDAASKNLPQIVPIGQRQAAKHEARGMGGVDETDPVVASFKRSGWSDQKISEWMVRTGHVREG